MTHHPDRIDWPSREEFIQRNKNGERWSAMAAELGVTRTCLSRWVYQKTNPAAIDGADVSEREHRRRCIWQDHKFSLAMLRAKAKRQETVEVGVVTRSVTSASRIIRADPVFSGCGSSAALCADAGDDRVW